MNKSKNPADMDKDELLRTHEELHRAFKKGLDGWTKEDFINYHILVLEAIRRRGFQHTPADELDELTIKAKRKTFEASLGIVKMSAVKEDFFKEWNPDMAYMVGFIMADATIFVAPEKYQWRLSFEIGPKDLDLLKWFKEKLQYEGVIRKVADKTSRTMQINNKTLVQGLLETGLKPDKTGFPKVPDNLIVHAARGYFDANGSAWTVGNSLMLRFSGRSPVIEKWQKIIEEKTGVKHRKIIRTAGTNIIAFSGQDALKVAEWLYSEGGHYLERKKAPYDTVVTRTKQSEDLAPIGPSGIEEGPEIKLEDILPYFKSFKMSKPFIFLTGGLVNNMKTKGDIDILIRCSENDSYAKGIVFRIVRMFPEDLRGRLHFIFDDSGEMDGHGPFTSYVPLYEFVIEANPGERVEMSEGLIKVGPGRYKVGTK